MSSPSPVSSKKSGLSKGDQPRYGEHADVNIEIYVPVDPQIDSLDSWRNVACERLAEGKITDNPAAAYAVLPDNWANAYIETPLFATDPVCSPMLALLKARAPQFQPLSTCSGSHGGRGLYAVGDMRNSVRREKKLKPLNAVSLPVLRLENKAGTRLSLDEATARYERNEKDLARLFESLSISGFLDSLRDKEGDERSERADEPREGSESEAHEGSKDVGTATLGATVDAGAVDEDEIDERVHEGAEEGQSPGDPTRSFQAHRSAQVPPRIVVPSSSSRSAAHFSPPTPEELAFIPKRGRKRPPTPVTPEQPKTYARYEPAVQPRPVRDAAVARRLEGHVVGNREGPGLAGTMSSPEWEIFLRSGGGKLMPNYLGASPSIFLASDVPLDLATELAERHRRIESSPYKAEILVTGCRARVTSVLEHQPYLDYSGATIENHTAELDGRRESVWGTVVNLLWLERALEDGYFPNYVGYTMSAAR